MNINGHQNTPGNRDRRAWRDNLLAHHAAQAAKQRTSLSAAPQLSLKTWLGPLRYDYKPLNAAENEIRVLCLHDFQNFDDPIEASFRIGSLDDWPVHDCLSYVWGTEKPACLMSLDGKSFEITAHLQLALQRYRSVDGGRKTRMIWVDAICINQVDASEKAQQVRMMQQIYERAVVTYAYLGERRPEGPSLRGLELLEPRNRTQGGSSEVARSQDEAAVIWNEHDIDQTEATAAMMEMLVNPWFRRAWIVQEGSHSLELQVLYGDVRFRLVVVAAMLHGWNRTNVIADETSREAFNDMNDSARALRMMIEINVSWTSHNPTFRRVAFQRHMRSMVGLLKQATDAHKLQFSDREDQIHVESAEDGKTLLHLDDEAVMKTFTEQEKDTKERPYRLIDLLRDFSFTRATNRRDKIYSLLNLASDAQDAPAIDYTLTVNEVFLQFASYLIGKGSGIEVLQEASQNIRDGPLSWVPTWSEGDLRRHSFYFEINDLAEYRAGGELQPVVYLDDAAPATCTVYGRIVDTIAEVSEVPKFSASADYASGQQWWIGPLSSAFSMIVNTGYTIKLPLCDHDGNKIWYRDWLHAAANDTLHGEIQQFDQSSREQLLRRLAKYANQLMKWKLYHIYKGDNTRTIGIEVEAAEAISMTKDPLEAMFPFLFDPKRISESVFSPADQRAKFPYRTTIPKMLHGRRLCFTKEGYIGVVPSEAAAGDAIAVVAGAQMPFVLRDAADGDDGYLLRGDCYLRGFMHGEGIRETDVREIRLV